MSSLRHGVRIVAALAAAVSGLVFLPPTGSAAATNFCTDGSSYSGTTITWTGKANHDWNNPNNWSPKTVPDASHTPATYQTQYVCIGHNSGGGAAKVEITKGRWEHIAGIDINSGAQLTVDVGARLFLGSKPADPTVQSYVRSHGQLLLVGAVLGGNAPVTVSGTMRWEGGHVGKHKVFATQTSSECVYDPTIPACPGDTAPGGGLTTIASAGKLLVDGSIGGVNLTDQRVIDNSGAITISHNGFVVMNGGTTLNDEHGSSIDFAGVGGIYQGPKGGHSSVASVVQRGSVRKDGKGFSIVGVPVSFAKNGAPHVRVLQGGLSLQRSDVPTSKVARGSMYGVGGCTEHAGRLCRRPDADKTDPQVATVGTSTAAPKSSKIGVSLADGPKKLHGHGVIGQSINVTAPTIKTTHSTHLTFAYDKTTKGVAGSSNAGVYRGKHRITLCKVHGLTAKNTSCVLSEKIAHGGPDKGDLTIILITIQPNARWAVAK